MSVDQLVAALRQALDADEAHALEAQRRSTTSRRMIGGKMVDVPVQPMPEWRRSVWSPERALAVVAAHRRILDNARWAFRDAEMTGGDPRADALMQGRRIALQAVIELHRPELFGGVVSCLACSPGLPPPVLIESPCLTLLTVAEALGVEVDG